MLKGLVRSCHDLSEGGLALALAEMCLAGRLGADVTLPASDLSAIEFLFSESNGRLLIEVDPADAESLEHVLLNQKITHLGEVTQRTRLHVSQNGADMLDLAIEQIVGAWKCEMIS
jgi:phosphoribosylformylglycinamidine (FGAM) synthase-like enzyme